ncbi:MAG: Swt1 family HEPN domain-containing protein [Pseudomonadota bacterium]
MNSGDKLRSWLFRAMLFETDAERLRAAGIRVGAGSDIASAVAWDQLLAPFSVESRARALRMAQLYALLHCFENAVRDLVVQRLSEVEGENWWQTKVAPNIQKAAQQVYDKAVSNAWLDGTKSRLVDFTTFGQLVKIIIDNWADFEYIIPTQSWLNQKMGEMEDVRNFVAHSRNLSQREFDRMLMYVEDWNRQVGL